MVFANWRNFDGKLVWPIFPDDYIWGIEVYHTWNQCVLEQVGKDVCIPCPDWWSVWYTVSNVFNGAIAKAPQGPGWEFINSLRPRQNRRHFPDIFKCILLKENKWISINMSTKLVPKGPINNIPALVQLTAWCRLSDKSLSDQWWYVYWRIYASLGLNELYCNDCIHFRLN